MRICVLLFVVFSCVFTHANDIVYPTTSSKSDVDLKKNLVWNKWDTDNFIVLSIDKNQGIQLKSKADEIRLSFLSKWGLEGSIASLKCKIICTPDKDLLKELFGLDSSMYEVRTNSSGSPSLAAVWMHYASIDDLPFFIANVAVHDLSFSWFLKRGLPVFEKSPSFIRSRLENLSLVPLKKIFSTTREEWTKLSTQERETYDLNSFLLCLLLRKELGIVRFNQFVASDQSEESLGKIYGFTFSNLDETLKRYAHYLCSDIKEGKTPDEYLIAR